MADKSKMKCNVPRREVQGGKKFVVKACEGGKEKLIRFGDANMAASKYCKNPNYAKKSKGGKRKGK